MDSDEATLGIGELARLVGVSTHALRVWERRYDSPNPVRKPSGHRRYPVEEVERLKLVGVAIRMGHRASLTVPLNIEALQKLIEQDSSDRIERAKSNSSDSTESPSNHS